MNKEQIKSDLNDWIDGIDNTLELKVDCGIGYYYIEIPEYDMYNPHKTVVTPSCDACLNYDENKGCYHNKKIIKGKCECFC